jgi:hypothetical protein
VVTHQPADALARERVHTRLPQQPAGDDRAAPRMTGRGPAAVLVAGRRGLADIVRQRRRPQLAAVLDLQRAPALLAHQLLGDGLRVAQHVALAVHPVVVGPERVLAADPPPVRQRVRDPPGRRPYPRARRVRGYLT